MALASALASALSDAHATMAHAKVHEDYAAADPFSSPVPPTMSRHAIRSLLLWLLALPLGLAGSLSPTSMAAWSLLVSYIFVGIEEVGAQVEQPFEITPMTRLCNVILFNLEEAFAPPPSYLTTAA